MAFGLIVNTSNTLPWKHEKQNKEKVNSSQTGLWNYDIFQTDKEFTKLFFLKICHISQRWWLCLYSFKEGFSHCNRGISKAMTLTANRLSVCLESYVRIWGHLYLCEPFSSISTSRMSRSGIDRLSAYKCFLPFQCTTWKLCSSNYIQSTTHTIA